MVNLFASTSLKSRLALILGCLFTVLIAVVFLVIYEAFSKFRKDDFYSRLRDRAVTTYNLLVEVDAIDSSLLKVIDANTPNSIVPSQKVMVYADSTAIYSYGSNNDVFLKPGALAALRREQEVLYTIGQYEVLGLHRVYKDRDYFVLSSGYDLFGLRKLFFLRWVMVVAYVIALLIGWATIYILVSRAIKPLEKLEGNIAHLDDQSLDTRLPETGQGREVDGLSRSFNQLFSRLETAFRFQKDFVHYASHELRTPLSVMVSLTESALRGERTAAQYETVLSQILQQQRSLTDITNSLLLLSNSAQNPDRQRYPVLRLDELVFRSIDIVQALLPHGTIEFGVNGGEPSEEFFLFPGHEPLLIMAFTNLLKNAVQYSPDGCVSVSFNVSEPERELAFRNSGAPIAAAERTRIFTPFYRGSTPPPVPGHGLGLPLARQILQMHGATLRYEFFSPDNVFTIRFPS